MGDFRVTLTSVCINILQLLSKTGALRVVRTCCVRATVSRALVRPATSIINLLFFSCVVALAGCR